MKKIDYMKAHEYYAHIAQGRDARFKFPLKNLARVRAEKGRKSANRRARRQEAADALGRHKRRLAAKEAKMLKEIENRYLQYVAERARR